MSPWALREGILLHHLATVTNLEQPLTVESFQPVATVAPDPAVVTSINR